MAMQWLKGLTGRGSSTTETKTTTSSYSPSSVDPNAEGADTEIIERWKAAYRLPETTYLMPMSAEYRAECLAMWRNEHGKKSPELEREALMSALRDNNGENREMAREIQGILQTKSQPYFYPQAYEKVAELTRLLVRLADRNDEKGVAAIMAEARVVQERIAEIMRALNEEREDRLKYANPGRPLHLMRIGEITKELYELRLCLAELTDEKLGAIVRKRMAVPREWPSRSMHGYTKSQEDGQWNKGSSTMSGYTKDRGNGLWSKDENRMPPSSVDGHWRNYDSRGSGMNSSSMGTSGGGGGRGFY